MITPLSIKAKFPEFQSIPDLVIQGYINDSTWSFSPSVWSGVLPSGETLIDLGQSYFVAALLYNYQIQADDTTQAAPYIQKSAGNASVNLGVTAIDAKDPDALFVSNKYGQYYLSLRAQLGATMTSSALTDPGLGAVIFS